MPLHTASVDHPKLLIFLLAKSITCIPSGKKLNDFMFNDVIAKTIKKMKIFRLFLGSGTVGICFLRKKPTP